MRERADKWDAYGRERSPWRQRERFFHHRLAKKKIVSLLERMDRSIDVMDIGCGDGFFLNLLTEMGFRSVRGIDPGRPMVERCLERGFRAERKSLDELAGSECFDLVLLIEVLEHLNDPSSSVSKIKTLLRPGGRLLLTVPVCDSLLKRYHRFRYGTSKLSQVVNWDDTHLHAFSKKEITEMLTSRSFRIERSLHVSNLFPWVGRYGGERMGEFFQRLDLGGRFGDILVVLASTEQK